MVKLLRIGVPKCVVTWLKGFLMDRRFCAKVGDSKSEYVRFQNGLPQGSILSPLLFLVWIADLNEKMPAEAETLLFADDLAVATQDSDVGKAREVSQQAAIEIESWASKWKMKLAAEKSETMLFTQWGKETDMEVPITLNGEVIKTSKQVTFLGVTLDRKLSFSKHVQGLRQKVKQRLRQLSALSGRTWGGDEGLLRSVYTTYIRSALEYAGGAWMPSASETAIQELGVEQNRAARTISAVPLL